jgi:hypothetical protein
MAFPVALAAAAIPIIEKAFNKKNNPSTSGASMSTSDNPPKVASSNTNTTDAYEEGVKAGVKIGLNARQTV